MYIEEKYVKDFYREDLQNFFKINFLFRKLNIRYF